MKMPYEEIAKHRKSTECFFTPAMSD